MFRNNENLQKKHEHFNASMNHGPVYHTTTQVLWPRMVDNTCVRKIIYWKLYHGIVYIDASL
jgi:hypothetical protein